MRRTPRLRGPAGWLVAPLAVLTMLFTPAVAEAAPAPVHTDPPPATASAHGANGGPLGAGVDYRSAGCNSLTAAELNKAEPYARCFALGRATADGKLVVQPNTPPSTALTPSDLQDAYHLPDGGAGMTVAIVDAYGYASAESDLAVFREYYGLPACTAANGCFRKVDQRGGTDFPAEDNGWSIETALDLDAVSSVCPKCNLLLVEGDTANLGDLGEAVDTAVQLGAQVVSNSYGIAPEVPQETQYDAYYDHPGVAITASTGDTGNLAGWPATSGHVTAVGGTKLVKDTGNARGWAESAWTDGGSGCSPYEPRPDFQQGVETNCPNNRAVADIAADADPSTGIGVYNTHLNGWAQYGGTSLSAPLVAGMYALAGAATPNTYPASYPYRDAHAAQDLNDVTAGVDGSCGNLLCQAGTGWDGPTGLGTPNGVAALTQGEHGTISGTVTDGDGTALAGATVAAAAADGTVYHATSDDQGHYDLAVATGSYQATASKYGYGDQTRSDLTVAADATVTADFTLAKKPTDTVSGTVTDGSGHGWPLYAKITVDGYPNGAVYTNPYTGRYSVELPHGATYRMHVSSVELPDYVDQNRTVDLTGGTAAASPKDAGALTEGSGQDVALPVDTAQCTAVGYDWATTGSTTGFTGWTGGTPQDGWTVTDAAGTGQTWRFDNPGGWAPPAGDASFADIDSNWFGENGSQDSSLVSPAVDLSGAANPEIGFDTVYIGFPDQVGTVDLSTDDGATWSTVQTMSGGLGNRLDIPIPQAAGKSKVRVRFHFTGSWSRRWELDNVLIGTRTCAPTPGGLVAGVVRDGNTGDPLVGATVRSDADATRFGVTEATPDDPAVPDGYYWLFSSHTGDTAFTVTDARYSTRHASATPVADAVVHRNWKLGAGHLAVDKSSVSATETLGATATRQVTFHNDGTAPLHVRLAEEDGGFTPLGAPQQDSTPGAVTRTVRTATSLAAQPAGKAAKSATVDGHRVALRQGAAADGWQDVADYPTALMDDAVAYHDGKVYVVGGTTGSSSLASANVYDPATQSWSALADLPEALNGPVAAFVGGTLYVAGGWTGGTQASTHAYGYDPGSDTWSRVADMPSGAAMAGVAVLGGRLYVIGGCTTSSCAPSSTSVVSYDPSSDAWTAAPDYPTPIAYGSCGAASAELVCAGGIDASASTPSARTYSYSPGASGWTRRADLPGTVWGASAAAANGGVQIVGGVVDGKGVSNQALEYDPQQDRWVALPSANNAQYRGGGACGLYQVGGSAGSFGSTAFVQQLPGYGSCNGDADLPWLAEGTVSFEVAAGASVTVPVSLDSSAVAQPGDYLGLVDVATDTPYASSPVSVTMHVTPPKRWGKITGTVSDENGAPLAGATVQVCTMYDRGTGTCGPQSFTLATDGSGHYQLWLNKGFNPLEVIAAMAGRQPKMKVARVGAGATTTVDFVLPKI
ncbi:hypothetical protein Athai_50650 [Actinocatenispora thailandica]|uniref:Peptidase S53 domain-containing protein n=1 Tax=Actinocatenispora thailandica TaxID=227318 RepID=A0A7R7DU99_9ACTN|nr:carboxypeptidase regulatory-like domain-containing protein [Actinocatenispora thailandica]BCJ37562.1 hypothetical protein Athai_50650 [Actinocatenispora thailandica]